jgi:arylsulfatase A-like enzyme
MNRRIEKEELRYSKAEIMPLTGKRSVAGGVDADQLDQQIEEAVEDHDEMSKRTASSPSSLLNRVVSGILVTIVLASIIAAAVVAKSPQNFSKIVFGTQEEESSSRGASYSNPNIIFMLADDLSYGALSGDDYDLDFAAPFLSSLADNGIRMTNYYAQEVCTPSRASLLTGRYPITVGMQFNEVGVAVSWGLNLTEKLLPQELKENGYGTYMLGKWNLGHNTPKALPTARGFDYFMGFLTGESYFWSKKSVNEPTFKDLMYADKDCYAPYNGTDMHKYSTFLYRDKAVGIINEHDFDSAPMFMYLSFQGVHDPFIDITHYPNGVPDDYLTDDMVNQIHEKIDGAKRREYVKSLVLLDDAVYEVFEALESVGQMKNTYIIFTSDNGGCHLAGGKSGPLRGTKGTLWEGGTKVDAFVYSPLLPSSTWGTKYDGLMHVSDWFPTILEFALVDYKEREQFPLDGVSQALSMVSDTNMNTRTYMLYNYYTQVETISFNMWTNAPFAVRNSQYKLMHAYVNDELTSGWFDTEMLLEDDDSLVCGTCSQNDAMIGNYTYLLFDIINDPYETTNLYDDPSYSGVVDTLYDRLHQASANKRWDSGVSYFSKQAKAAWKERDNYITPWVKEASLKGKSGFPNYCTFSGKAVSPRYSEDDDTELRAAADVDDEEEDDLFADTDIDEEKSDMTESRRR